MRPPFRPVPDDLPADTAGALRKLLNQATRGEILGVAFVALYKNRTFIVNTTGEVRRSPVFARGLVAELDDAIASTTSGDA